MFKHIVLVAIALLILPDTAIASAGTDIPIDLTHHIAGYVAIIIFVLAYILVMAEEFTNLRKSKPVMVAAGIIWAMIGWIYTQHGLPHAAEAAVRHNILEYAELLLFLLVAMTYVNAMDERLVFEALRSWLINRGLNYRKLFWLTGILTFFLSPIIDNLTTALVMCAVITAVGKNSIRFISIACVNIVVAANAGGAFSPFGDITTLMVWQKGVIDFWTFFLLFIPAAVNYLVPAIFMHFAIPKEFPETDGRQVYMLRGAVVIIALFGLTIVTAVSFHNFLHLPPMVGMMTGLGYLKFYGFYLKKTHVPPLSQAASDASGAAGDVLPIRDSIGPFDVFHRLARAEWDTLLFFYGVVLCVGGLGFIGYLGMISEVMYVNMGATFSNVAVGILSAIVDNIPVMFAVLSMNPDMPLGQWLMVTLTAGVGGSLLSIGSAAGVALMGQARGKYTFFSHLKWSPVIALGYAASIMVHMWINAATFI